MTRPTAARTVPVARSAQLETADSRQPNTRRRGSHGNEEFVTWNHN